MKKKLVSELIIGIVAALIVGYIAGVIDYFYKVIITAFHPYPIFSGVMFSWFFAITSTGIILFFAYINHGKRDQYEKIFKKSEKWLMSVSIAVLFYISINLASEALTKVGVPIFSKTYEIVNFIQVSPQDAFLISVVFMTIFLLFFVAPRYEIRKLIIIIGLSLIISGLLILFFIFAKPVPESNQVNVVAHIGPFLVSTIFGLILTFVLWLRMPKEAKGSDLHDLCLYFSIMPAPIVASLVLIGHKFVTYPNLPGHMVVGFLFISGFASLVILTMISLKKIKIGFWIWIFAAVLSLFSISSFCSLFLFLEPLFCEIDTFRNILMYSIAIILLILQYGFSYEKLLKYRFTEWWRRVWRPRAMVISILAILVVGAISPEFKPWGIPFKLILVFLALFLVVCLPWILGLITFWKTFRKKIEFRGFKRPKIPPLLPRYQGMVLIKAETGPDKLKNVVNKLDSIKGVYQTMVVMGEYDVCLIVEGVDSDDIATKIFKIRKIEGVASTTTLTDIRESFDKMVK